MTIEDFNRMLMVLENRLKKIKDNYTMKPQIKMSLNEREIYSNHEENGWFFKFKSFDFYILFFFLRNRKAKDESENGPIFGGFIRFEKKSEIIDIFVDYTNKTGGIADEN